MKSFDCPHCHKVFKCDSGDSEIVLCPHCNGTVSLPEKDLTPGTMIGGFEIISLLGRGGMGNVYLAKQLSMKRMVALKILMKSLTRDKQSVEQFLNEARVSGSLNHPNIIPAIHAGEFEDTYYLATAYIEGEDLEKRLEKEHTIPEKEALKIAIKIGNALNYAWEAYGVLHKDIKPGNLMYDTKGEVFLMDMGIAQYIGEGTGGEDHILGSPFYMSPEQTTASRLSWTSDLYSLGATLYNLIVGCPPYDASEVMRIIEMHSSEPFPDPATRNPKVKVSKSTVELIRKMMEKKPIDRYDSWTGFIEAAEEALHSLERKPAQAQQKSLPRKHKTIPIKPSSRNHKVGKKRKRHAVMYAPKKTNPLMTMLLYMSLLLIASLLAFVIYKHLKNNVAEEAFNEAKRFMANHAGDYDSIILKFQQTAEKTENTKYENQIEQYILNLRRERIEQKKLIVKYKQALKEVVVLASKKQYDAAIQLMLRTTKNIKDPSVLREVDMKIKYYQSLIAKTSKNY